MAAAPPDPHLGDCAAVFSRCFGAPTPSRLPPDAPLFSYPLKGARLLVLFDQDTPPRAVAIRYQPAAPAWPGTEPLRFTTLAQGGNPADYVLLPGAGGWTLTRYAWFLAEPDLLTALRDA